MEFLDPKMHLLAAKPAPHGLAALAGRVARPYKIWFFVGAGLVPALARTVNGPKSNLARLEHAWEGIPLALTTPVVICTHGGGRMTEVILLDAKGQVLRFEAAEQAGVDAVVVDAAKWGEANSLKTLRFQLAEGSERELHVQFDDEPPLTSWVDLSIFRQGRVDEIESGLDFARGEFRRRAVGYSQFDR
jgi:hypothetical protein